MEITVTREELLHGLYLTQGIVERRTTIPILANVLIQSDENDIIIVATDQEIGLRRRCTAQVTTPGALTANARKLYEIVKECPNGDITIQSLDNHWITVSCGNSRFKIVGLDPSEFPAMPSPSEDTVHEAIIPSTVLREVIQQTVFAVALDETRPNLGGILLEQGEEGHIRAVATDGHRLSTVTRPAEKIALNGGAVIPRKGIQEISKVIEGAEDPVTIRVHGGVAHATQGNVELSMRLIEGDFPDYRQVIPSGSTRTMQVEAGLLRAALRRVSVVSSERTRGIKLHITPGKVDVSSINPDIGEANEEIDVTYEGEAFEIGFNAKYVMDALDVLPGESQIHLGFNDDVSPGVMRSDADPGFLYVVMPMRL